jgi:hypothetical protein
MFENQRGGALLAVMVAGTVAAMIFVSFLTSALVTESRAVDGELARSRAYWAQMGNYNYAMSRIAYSRLCNGCGSNRKDTDFTPILQAYFNELSNNTVWTYPDESANYTITTLAPTAAPDNNPLRQNFSGWLMATSSVSSSALVSGMNSHLPIMELRLCVGRPAGGGPAAKCGNIANNNGGNTTSYFSVNRLTNLGG